MSADCDSMKMAEMFPTDTYETNIELAARGCKEEDPRLGREKIAALLKPGARPLSRGDDSSIPANYERMKLCNCGFFGPVGHAQRRCPSCFRRFPRRTRGYEEMVRIRAADAGIPYGGC